MSSGNRGAGEVLAVFRDGVRLGTATVVSIRLLLVVISGDGRYEVVTFAAGRPVRVFDSRGG